MCKTMNTRERIRNFVGYEIDMLDEDNMVKACDDVMRSIAKIAEKLEPGHEIRIEKKLEKIALTRGGRFEWGDLIIENVSSQK